MLVKNDLSFFKQTEIRDSDVQKLCFSFPLYSAVIRIFVNECILSTACCLSSVCRTRCLPKTSFRLHLTIDTLIGGWTFPPYRYRSELYPIASVRAG